MKRFTICVMLSSILVVGTASAEEQETTYVNDPNSPLYELIHAIEKVKYEYTEDWEEKIDILLENANKRMLEIEENEVVDPDLANRIIEHIQENIEEIEKKLDEAEENGEDITEIEEEVVLHHSNRGNNLLVLLERENLPEQAKAGIRRALANQERAMEKRAEAKLRVEMKKALRIKMEEESKVESEVEETEHNENQVIKEHKEETASLKLEYTVGTNQVEEKEEQVEEEAKEIIASPTKVKGNEKAAQARQHASERANNGKSKGQERAKQARAKGENHPSQNGNGRNSNRP
ncbi:DUF5667 domain-containing protein [Bacillus sp. FJAT-45350]|uniref:DUF5667 domain-containing protein n=1 Tax=Bacillus sp. FJAT-45350 TaxID=2011014 RepID=UPI000BB7401D|nr:DUF5667 domain-containing protein [Bacillus sp. FJAT-45350]